MRSQRLEKWSCRRHHDIGVRVLADVDVTLQEEYLCRDPNSVVLKHGRNNTLATKALAQTFIPSTFSLVSNHLEIHRGSKFHEMCSQNSLKKSGRGAQLGWSNTLAHGRRTASSVVMFPSRSSKVSSCKLHVDLSVTYPAACKAGLEGSLVPFSFATSYTVNISLLHRVMECVFHHIRHMDVHEIYHDVNVCASVSSSGPTESFGVLDEASLVITGRSKGTEGTKFSVGYFPQSPYPTRTLLEDIAV